jgi:rhodanese-related sulfurtransferase
MAGEIASLLISRMAVPVIVFHGEALPGAVNVSLGDAAFDRKVGGLDRKRPILVYCAGGFRSRKAVERLKAMGFENIRHLHRGYMSWKPDKPNQP